MKVPIDRNETPRCSIEKMLRGFRVTFFSKFGRSGRDWTPHYADRYADLHFTFGTALLRKILTPIFYADFFIRVRFFAISAVQWK